MGDASCELRRVAWGVATTTPDDVHDSAARLQPVLRAGFLPPGGANRMKATPTGGLLGSVEDPPGGSLPGHINHSGSGPMMMKSSTWSSVLGSHPASKPDQSDDRWMVTHPRDSLYVV
jgi:hypothetical protein